MLTWSSLKAYFRNRGAIFFSLLVPLMIMGIFGLINFGNTTPVQSRNLTYVDFLVPGMIALSIMQTGLFGVVFTFVQWKQRGILRRLMATPMRVRDFFFSQLVTRLTTVALQIVVLLAVGLLLFHFHFAGNLPYLPIVGIIGGGIFPALGLG